MKTPALETPMMRQYQAIKARHPDAIVFYRMGDFYEMFLADAELAAPLLDIALTTRDKGKPDAVPMCGIPVHSADGYVKRLAELGHRVAICEQVEDPKNTPGRQLVRRDVVEVITPGLVGDPSGLEAGREFTLAALHFGSREEGVGLAALDASTGDFRATRSEAVAAEGAPPALLCEELVRVAPRELLVNRDDGERLAVWLAAHLPRAVVTVVPEESFEPARSEAPSDGLDAAAGAVGTRAAAALLSYLASNQPFAAAHAPALRHYALADNMVLDAATRSHLELFENSEDRSSSNTLLDLIDRTRTPLGARRLARWLRYPLIDPAAIGARQDAVQFLHGDRRRAALRQALSGVRDLERLLAKSARPGATPRDLGLLRSSLESLPAVVSALSTGFAPSEDLIPTHGLPSELVLPEPLPELQALLRDGLVEDPPVVARGSRGANETGYIRAGFRPELDLIRESASKGREWIAGLESSEREQSGISTLKVRYHPVHGYSLEVPKSQLDRVPDHYERKQTLANVERFTTDGLREVESVVMGATERAAALEREIFEDLRQSVVVEAERIRTAADAVAQLDALASLAEVARHHGWVRPFMNSGEKISIRGGRHPVVEAVAARVGADGFVPNDTDLDPEDAQILMLTGPNMSGKSTYLRQVASIVLLAQVGSFVPADEARIGVVDRIFTRVGASDRLARGESTFMVEMREAAEILRQASRRSLVILDEIGRGTSTFDGLSIAWSVAEYLHDTPSARARTLFATHYHELTELAQTKPRVRNAHFQVREWKDEVIFLKRLAPGGANRSYGIQVARLAGLPDSVIARARQILANLEGGEFDREGRPRLARDASESGDGGQLGLFPNSGAAEREVLDALRALDPETTTPLAALEILHAWKASLADDGEAS